MSEQQSERITLPYRKSSNSSTALSQAGRQESPARLPPAKEDTSNHTKSEALIQKCSNQGVWTMADEELDLVIKDILSPQTPPKDVINPREHKAMIQCHEEQGHRREAARATRLLQRYRLVERRYLELRQDSRQKEKPSPDYALKRKALEQIMRETKDQTQFPLAPTNDSLSHKIQDFAIKAQRKPYLSIGMWGFAVLRLNYGDEAAWESYKTLLKTTAQKLLLLNNVPQHTCKMFRFTYIEDESALSGPVDQTKLAEYWHKNRHNEMVHLQINKQFFLSADEFVREGDNPNDPPFNIHDASVEEVEEGTFPGFRKTSIYELISWHIPGIEKSRLHLRTVWEMTNS